jgi:2-oxo-4-hydroxy-4-carboxy--5-ureidoimidazoline (OHCU) decarboxylase
VICARENKKDAILEAFPARLALDADEERAAVLVEISRIGWLWLVDAVTEAAVEQERLRFQQIDPAKLPVLV